MQKKNSPLINKLYFLSSTSAAIEANISEWRNRRGKKREKTKLDPGFEYNWIELRKKIESGWKGERSLHIKV